MVKVRRNLVVLLLLALTLFSVSAAPCAYYFYGEGCKGCAPATEAVDRLSQKFTIQKHEVFYQPENVDVLRQYFATYGVAKESQGLPALILDKTYYVGYQPIAALGESAVEQSGACPTLTTGERIGIVGEHSALDIFDSLSLFTVAAASFQDALRPGALAVVLLFLMLLLASPEQLMKRGAWFIIGSFLALLLFALGFYSWFAASSYSVLFYRVMGGVAVAYALFILKVFFWPQSKLGFSKTLRWLWAKGFHHISGSGSMLVVGFIASLFSLAQVQPVLLSMRFAFRDHSGWLSIPFVIIYILLTMIPLGVSYLIVLWLRKKGDTKAEMQPHREKWKLHEHRLLRLGAAAIVGIVGILLLF